MEILSHCSEVSGVNVDWFQYNQVCPNLNKSFLPEKRCWTANAPPGQQWAAMSHLLVRLSSSHTQQTFIHYGWGPRKFLKHLWRQFHITYSCHLPLFLLTEGIKKKMTQTAVQIPVLFSVAKVKPVWTAVTVKHKPGGLPVGKFGWNL